MYAAVHNLVQPNGHHTRHSQQDYHHGHRYADGFKLHHQGFTLLRTQNQAVFPPQEDCSHYHGGDKVTECHSNASYAGEVAVSAPHSATIGPRNTTQTPNYDFGSFDQQTPVEASVKLYSRGNDVTDQGLPAGNHLEFQTRENRRFYNGPRGNETQASNWLGDERGERSPCQSSPVISVSPITQEEDWYLDTRRHSTSSTGSEEYCPFLDSGDGEDKDKYSQNRVLPPCRICGAKASGFHYGVNSCEACKGFFRRALKRPITFHCTKDNTCDIKGNRRSTCRFCRYKRCLRLGMSRNAIKTGRYSHRKRTSDIIEVKQLENTPGFPVDELDFDDVLDSLMATHDAQKSLAASQKTEAEIYAYQSKLVILRGLRKVGKEGVDSALPALKTFSEKDKNGVSGASMKDTHITPKATINNNGNISDKSEDGQLADPNSSSSSNANGGYPNSGASSPSPSSTSNDSGFNEDGLSPADESEKGKMAASGGHEPLDLSLKRKREDDEEEEISEARRSGAHLIPEDTDVICLTSPERVDCQSDLAEVSYPLESRPASMAGITSYHAEQFVPSFSTDDDPLTSSSAKGSPEDSDDSSCVSGHAQKRRKLGTIEDMPGNSPGQKLPDDCFLAQSYFFGQQDDQRSTVIKEVWPKGDSGPENRCGRKASDSSESSPGLTADMDQGNGNDVADTSVLWRSTVKGGHDDDVRMLNKELTKRTSDESAKKWVTGYINFANSIPGFTDLPAKTKGSLLRQSWDEVWMLQAYSGYNRGLKVVTLPSGKCFVQEEMDAMWGRENTQVAFDVANVIKKCRLTPEMLVLLKAVCIVSPDRCPTEGRDKVEQIHWCLVTCLFKVIENMNTDDVRTFPKLVTVLTSLRNLSESGQWNRQDGYLDKSFGIALFPDCLSL